MRRFDAQFQDLVILSTIKNEWIDISALISVVGHSVAKQSVNIT